jgi:hypothetical protein
MLNLPDPKAGCHLTGFTKKCGDLVTKGICKRWMHITGVNPNTGETINEARCTDDWLPLLMIENSKLQRETGAAVESFRNEMVKANEMGLAALIGEARRALDATDHHPER